MILSLENGKRAEVRFTHFQNTFPPMTEEQALREIRDHRASSIRYRVREYQPKEEVWIIELFLSGTRIWTRSMDFCGEYPSKEEAVAAFSKSTNDCGYRAVRKNKA